MRVNIAKAKDMLCFHVNEVRSGPCMGTRCPEDLSTLLTGRKKLFGLCHDREDDNMGVCRLKTRRPKFASLSVKISLFTEVLQDFEVNIDRQRLQIHLRTNE